jgi:hypothetical protein
VKTCTHCQQTKESSEFPPNRYRCKDCFAKYRAEKYLKNRDKVIKQAKEWATNHIEKVREANRKWRSNNLDKIRAHQTVARMKRRGEIVPDKCFVCGCEEVEAHHYNGYDNRLDIVWLCRSCHKDVHRGYKKGFNTKEIIK